MIKASCSFIVDLLKIRVFFYLLCFVNFLYNDILGIISKELIIIYFALLRNKYPQNCAFLFILFILIIIEWSMILSMR